MTTGERWRVKPDAPKVWPTEVVIVHIALTIDDNLWVTFSSSMGEYTIHEDSFLQAFELAPPRTRYDFILLEETL